MKKHKKKNLHSYKKRLNKSNNKASKELKPKKKIAGQMKKVIFCFFTNFNLIFY